MRRHLVLPVLVIAAAACGSDDPDDASTEPLYEVSGTVIEADHPPTVCSTVLESYPPICGGGVALLGWDWEDVEGEESAGSVTFGEFHVVGTWDGSALTITQTPGAPQPQQGADPDLTSPCPEPSGGWTIRDASRMTEDLQIEAIGVARADPGFAGAWLDQSRNPAHADGEIDSEDEIAHMNDPMFVTVNARTTGDTAALTAAMEAGWGGPVCVSSAQRTLVELEAIQQEIGAEGHGASIDEPRNIVIVDTNVADEATIASFDERFGPGVVEVYGWLQPYDGE